MSCRAIGIACIVWVATACGSTPVPVAVESGLEFDPAQYESYFQVRLAGDEDARSDEEIEIDRSIRTEIDRALQDHGYEKRTATESQLLVSYVVNSESEVRLVNAADPDTDYYVPKKITTDTLVIAVFDAERGQPVWRASADAETMIGGALIPESRERSILRAARSLLNAIPERR